MAQAKDIDKHLVTQGRGDSSFYRRNRLRYHYQPIIAPAQLDIVIQPATDYLEAVGRGYVDYGIHLGKLAAAIPKEGGNNLKTGYK